MIGMFKLSDIVALVLLLHGVEQQRPKANLNITTIGICNGLGPKNVHRKEFPCLKRHTGAWSDGSQSESWVSVFGLRSNYAGARS